MDHPVVVEVETFGYPKAMQLQEYVMTDSRNNEIYTGDEYLEYDGETFLIEPLTIDAIEILEILGAIRETAK